MNTNSTTPPGPATTPLLAAPPNLQGLYVQIDPRNIGEGEMLRELESALNEGVTKLLARWKQNGARKGDLKVQLNLTISAAKDSDEWVAIVHSIGTKLPSMQNKTLAKAAEGRLIVQPSGSNEGNPNQQLLFDARGLAVGKLVDGQVAPLDEVAGRIGGTNRA